jgi:hypothetical protein
MARAVDGRKWAAWRERWRRFERAGVPVTRFCAAEGVSVAAFYRWRRRRLAAERDEAREAGPAFAPVTVVGAAMLVAEWPGGTRVQVPVGDGRWLPAVIEALATADARRSAGGAAC